MSEEACGAQGGEPAAEQAEGTQEAPAAQVDLEAELRQETALKEKYLAGWQRAQADLENLKKRVAREQAEMRTVVVEAFVKSMLPALDSLERATKHARGSGADDSITQGLDLVMNKFLECLEREGITPISASGEPYDPMRHEAILRVPTAEVEEGTVLDEVQRGYASRDRVIRPALVTVACRPASESEDAPYSAGGDQEPDGRGQPGNGDAGADE
ncbi:MAG: nucleotide exchange factor GrpE [Bacillota bacterium]